MYSILIIDDNIGWCDSLKTEIDGLGIFDVLPPVYNGKDAIDSIEINRPDIIVLDLILPLYDGLYITNYISYDMKQYQPFIYVLSAIGTEKTNKIMKNLNADYYSVKPIAADAVATNILNITSRWDIPKKVGNENNKTKNRQHISHNSIDVDKFIDSYLCDLGVQLYRISAKCTRLALKLALEDDSFLSNQNSLYRKICELMPRYSNIYPVEKSLRSTIKAIHEAATSYYFNCFPEVKSKLTNAEFLNKSVYILRQQIEDYLSD